MSKETVITNERIKCVISSLGAEIQSLTVDGKEMIWEGNPDVWSGRAPVLFPICGGLKDDKYVLDGREYTLPKHGFCRNSEFVLEKHDDKSATFLLLPNEETLKAYPFDFELRITYTLSDLSLKVDYNIANMSTDDMYFSIGSHEAYACPEGIEEYSIVFEKDENLNSSILNGNLLEYDTVSIGENIRELPLKYEYFAVDALVFLDIKSRKATLMHNNERVVEVDFEGADYLLLWTKPNGKYICIEPWCGLPDFEDSDYNIENKRGIITIAPGGFVIKSHILTF